MNLIKHQAKLVLPLLALIFIACSPQRKVQQYSYLVKHKASDDLVATNSSFADPNLRPPISTSTKEEILIEGKYKPKTSGRKKYSPAKADTKQAPPIGQTDVRKDNIVEKTSKQDAYPKAQTVRRKNPVSEDPNIWLDQQVGQTDIRKDNPILEEKQQIEDPLSKTEVKEPIDVSLIEAPKVSMPDSSPLIMKLRKEEVRKIVSTADRFMGTPYKYGGMNGQGIDCSGLICEAYSSADISLPRSSWGMAKAGQQISLQQVAPGHLLFFHSYKGKGVNHVAMVSKVSGDEIEFIHATVNNGVRKDKLSDPYWKERFRMAVVPTHTKNKSTAP